ncbi:MAG TPA: SMP-30/gluconolactonase/LRE family protein [Casimicrobiaceae bacterium]|jgi:sugar lactone lactonase YvrE
MKRFFALSVLFLLALVSLPTLAWNRSPATTFAALPSGATTPEGITVDGSGNVYVSTFGFPEPKPSIEPGRIVVFDSHGKLLRQLIVSGASPHLLGLGVNPVTGQLLVADFGAGKVLSVDPLSGASQVFSDIGPTSGLNALTFDSAGNVYISDSFQGIIWQTGPNGGAAVAWASDPLLVTTGVPPFGANGLAFNSKGALLYVANTGDDSVVQIPVSGGAAGQASILAYSINGADGLIVDSSDNIWVAANQSDEIAVLDPTGKVIAKLGDFDGIDPNGAARGLLFPASLVFSGESVLVTNLALDLGMPVFGFPTVDSQWAAQVTRYTVSKISRHLPPVPGTKH